MKLKTLITVSMSVVALGITALPVSAIAGNGFSQQPLMLAANQTHHGEATVTDIDHKGKRIKLKHGPIKSIGWMGMNMYFSVEDKELLDEVEVGDKVKFDFIETRDKRYVVTDIEAE